MAPYACTQLKTALRRETIELVLATDMKQHFSTCGLFASKVLSPALARQASAGAPGARGSGGGGGGAGSEGSLQGALGLMTGGAGGGGGGRDEASMQTERSLVTQASKTAKGRAIPINIEDQMLALKVKERERVVT